MDTKTTNKKTQDFNPAEHLTDIKGKDYLEVKWRLVWFRQEKPTWSIETESIGIKDNAALFKATIKDETGRVIATAHKFENVQGFGDFIEKAETGSIGRALALVGYGTQFAPELEEGTERIVDAPVDNGAKSEELKPTWKQMVTIEQFMVRNPAEWALIMKKNGIVSDKQVVGAKVKPVMDDIFAFFNKQPAHKTSYQEKHDNLAEDFNAELMREETN